MNKSLSKKRRSHRGKSASFMHTTGYGTDIGYEKVRNLVSET